MSMLSGDEIFRLAAEMEETGRAFYEAVAAGCGNIRMSALCRRLAAQEQEHGRTFQRLRQDLDVRPPPRPRTPEELAFALALVRDRVIPDLPAAHALARAGTVDDALDLAVQVEKDSILFYTDILPAVDPADAPAVQQIIQEEKRHLRDLIAAREVI